MDVLIIGAGGHGRVVLDILRAQGQYRPIGFLDADPSLTGQIISGLEVLGPVNLLHKLKSQKVKGAIVGIGDNNARLRYAKLVMEQGLELINAIHPSAVVSQTAILGRNIVIAPGAVVGTDARIADSVIVNTSAVIDHECEICQGTHICPAAALAGRVRIGVATFVGLGSRIIQCLKIGDGCVIGAGAVVIRDVEDGATVVGVPARVLEVADAAGR
jgi:sugar O-acyltransferase (sialic acid O-acetyltransferase NeuD family)